MTGPDGLEERTALTDEQTRRADAEGDDAWDLAADFAGIHESMGAVKASIIKLREERDRFHAALTDIAFGAVLMLEGESAWPESALQFATEIRNVARAAVQS